MEKRKKFIINFLYFAIIIAAIFFALQFALSLLFPFVAALFIAYILKHPINFIARKTKMPRKLAAILMVLIFYGTIGTFLVLASIRAFSFATDLVQRLPSIFRIYVNPVLIDLFDQLEQRWNRQIRIFWIQWIILWSQFMQSLRSIVSNLSLTSMEAISNVASSLPMLFIKLLLMVISTFFYCHGLREADRFLHAPVEWMGQRHFPAGTEIRGRHIVCLHPVLCPDHEYYIYGTVPWPVFIWGGICAFDRPLYCGL